MHLHLNSLLKTTVSQNAIANAIRTFLQVTIGFFGSYVLIRSVTSQEFGAWALTLTFASFLGLVDFGIATAIIKYTAANHNNTAKIFWTANYYYSIMGLAAGLIIILIQYLMRDTLFRGYTPSLIFIATAVAGTYIGWLAANCNNILNGLQLMKRTSFLEVVKSVLFYFCIIPLIPRFGLYAFPLGFLLSNILGYGLSIIMIKGKADLSYKAFDIDTFKTLIKYGIKSYGMHLTALFKMSFIKIVTSQLFNLQYVAYVEMSQKIGSYIRQIYSSISLPLLPASSSYQASGDRKKIRQLFWYSQTIFACIGVISTALFIPLAPFLVKSWLGSSYNAVIPIAILESISIFFNMFLVAAFTIYQGLGRFKPILSTFAIEVVLMLFLLPIFALLLGFHGMYYGFILVELISTLIFFSWFIKNKIPL